MANNGTEKCVPKDKDDALETAENVEVPPKRPRKSNCEKKDEEKKGSLRRPIRNSKLNPRLRKNVIPLTDNSKNVNLKSRALLEGKMAKFITEKCPQKEKADEIAKNVEMPPSNSNIAKKVISSTDNGGNVNLDPTKPSNNVDASVPIQYHYEVDLREMAARNTINVANFKNYLRDQFQKKAKVNDLALNVTVKHEEWKVIVKSETFFKKSVIKWHAKKFLKSKDLRHSVKVVGNGNNDYRFTYYQPSSAKPN